MKNGTKIFAANWKLHKSPQETRDFFASFVPSTKNVEGKILFFTPASSWEATAQSLKGSKIGWGAQNVWTQAQGAFTGENSAAVLKNLGAEYSLVGHSERRKLFQEPDAWITDKVSYLQSLGVTPLLCFGETLEEREAGRTNAVNQAQLESGLAKADRSKPVIFAYEPVWAIGTGKVATPQQVAEAHQFIAGVLEKLGFGKSSLLYGGSVKADNAKSLLAIPHVDGFLVGGASLETATFAAICQA